MESLHIAGLESEHSFELASDGLGKPWPVKPEDEMQINKIIRVINRKRSIEEPFFIWNKNTPIRWTFGYVKRTGKSQEESLALHMLHRHGLAPLLASRSEEFANSFNRTANEDGLNAIEFFVRAQENLADVIAMKQMLENLDLSALRNLHAFDHEWSKSNSFSPKVDGCSSGNDGLCILQIGQYQRVHDFLTRNGFTEGAAEQTHNAYEDVNTESSAILKKNGNTFRNTWMDPFKTGSVVVPSTYIPKLDKGDTVVKGHILFEHAYGNQLVKVPVPDESWKQRFKDISEETEQAHKEKRKMFLDLFNEWYDDQMLAHTEYMQGNNIQIWSMEMADFWDMYPRYAKATA